jgi:two-component system CheB/CheR fusion protein
VTARVAPDVAPAAMPAARESDIDKSARRVMEKHLPAYVVVDRNHDVIRFSGETETYLGPSPGTASLNLFSLVRKPLRAPARSALQTALATKAMVRQENLLVQTNRHRRFLDLIVEPLGDGHFVMAFAERPAPAAARDASALPEPPNDSLAGC